jgi:hypothetical protein
MQVLSPEIAALRADQYEVIGEKVTYGCASNRARTR